METENRKCGQRKGRERGRGQWGDRGRGQDRQFRGRGKEVRYRARGKRGQFNPGRPNDDSMGYIPNWHEGDVLGPHPLIYGQESEVYPQYRNNTHLNNPQYIEQNERSQLDHMNHPNQKILSHNVQFHGLQLNPSSSYPQPYEYDQNRFNYPLNKSEMIDCYCSPNMAEGNIRVYNIPYQANAHRGCGNRGHMQNRPETSHICPNQISAQENICPPCIIDNSNRENRCAGKSNSSICSNSRHYVSKESNVNGSYSRYGIENNVHQNLSEAENYTNKRNKETNRKKGGRNSNNSEGREKINYSSDNIYQQHPQVTPMERLKVYFKTAMEFVMEFLKRDPITFFKYIVSFLIALVNVLGYIYFSSHK